MSIACVCEGGGLRAALRDDLDRYVYVVSQHDDVSGPLLALRVGLLSQGLWATAAYRLNHYLRTQRGWRPLAVIAEILHRILMAVTGIHIDPRAHIGSGLKFPHAGHIVIGPVRMGTNCDIFQGVTLGKGESTLNERLSEPDVPTFGDRVWLGPGAVVAGAVRVASDAVVSANSLLVRDVPAKGVMLGVPARLVSRQGSFTQILYRTMESDLDRKTALAAAD